MKYRINEELAIKEMDGVQAKWHRRQQFDIIQFITLTIEISNIAIKTFWKELKQTFKNKLNSEDYQ